MLKKIGLSLCILALVGLSMPIPNGDAQFARQVWVMYLGFWTEDGWRQAEEVMTDYPLSYYNSSNPGVAYRQIQQAQNTGIDAFLVSWFGTNSVPTTATLNNMLNQAAALNFQIGAVVDVFDANFNRSQGELIGSIGWLIENRTTHPAYLRFDGKPVIYFAFQEAANLSSNTWLQIRNQVDPLRQTIWVAEGLNGCCIHDGAFDGMYAFNLAWSYDPLDTARRQFRSTRNAGGWFYTPTVHPGWDESLVAARDGRPNPTSPRDRNGGQFLIDSWNGAIGSDAGIVVVVSWNEFMENSHIEPSQNYGTQALDTLRPLIRDWKAGRTPIQPTPEPDPTEALPTDTPEPDITVNEVETGTTLTINVESLNVRAEPSVDSAPIASVFLNERYEVLGESDGWFLIEVYGQEGYVAGDFVILSQ